VVPAPALYQPRGNAAFSKQNSAGFNDSVSDRSFGIVVDRKHAAKWHFHQENATLQYIKEPT
jgi:hypothetical protein